MKHHIIKLIIILFFFIGVSCSSQNEKKYVYQKGIMYTSFDIVLYSKSPKFQITAEVDKVWDTLDNLEYELSPAGEGFLGQLNTKGFIAEQKNPKIFHTVSNFIILSKNINKKSDGMFDLTVYPLIRLWGFYLQDEGKRVPTDQEIQDTLKQMGMQNIVFTNNGILLKNNVKIDLGAIAKGYAVDVAIEMLKEIKEISAGFVNAGGNIRVYGTKPDKTPWKVGIRNPNGGAVEEIVSLYDGESIATSGDYEQYFEADGVYYHHIFDPKTGKPVTHNLASISVVLRGSAEETDILATTFLVLGTAKAKELALKLDNKDISLFFIERKKKELFSEANESWLKRI